MQLASEEVVLFVASTNDTEPIQVRGSGRVCGVGGEWACGVGGSGHVGWEGSGCVGWEWAGVWGGNGRVWGGRGGPTYS